MVGAPGSGATSLGAALEACGTSSDAMGILRVTITFSSAFITESSNFSSKVASQKQVVAFGVIVAESEVYHSARCERWD